MNKIVKSLLLILILGSDSFSQPIISIEPKPSTIYREQGENKQLILSRLPDNNSTVPSIRTIPGRAFTGLESKLIFNPFTEFNPAVSPDTPEFEFVFSDNKREEFIERNLFLLKNIS